MLFGNYFFSCIFEADAILPPYKGSTFRGVFGHALKKVVCALKKQGCVDCLLRPKCLYAFVFETPGLESQSMGKKRVAAPPHPYVIEPSESSKTHYRPGDSFEFNLLLFGKANDYLPYFIYAFDQIGKLGLGKRINGIRGTFRLKGVSAERQVIYSDEDKKIKGDYRPEDLSREIFFLPKKNSALNLKITLKTPLRLKFHNQLEASLPFHILTRAMLRRISSLFNYYDQGEPPLDYKGLVKKAQSVKVKDSSLSWYDWRRYSNKQDQSMLMGGMLGSVTYEGDLSEFIPLVKFCEKVHLGKQTSFGLGKIEMVVFNP
ncbi:MAG TPA: CRISPR system precrRNA processing endoribonuclease RAMP protein Cas6 [Thermodesulfobacteriota bacterium]|nr:CRISPR system precrRNA processing endoribonuclease RAMP protein Cas6 [Thermodesulfobacteriota bacterium]